MNTNIQKAVVITRNHIALNFGQIVEILFTANNVADVIPEGERNVTKNISYIHTTSYWPCDRIHEYDALNEAVARDAARHSNA